MNLTRSFHSLSRRTSRLKLFRGEPTSTSRHKRVVTTITAILVAAMTAGCGVRLEVAPPSELEPTRDEIARQSVVLELNTIAQLSTIASADSQADVSTYLVELARVSQERALELGGQYESGLPTTEGSEPEATTPSLPSQASAQDVITALSDSALRIRSTVNLPDDAQLARLLASISIAHVSQAQQLGTLTGIESAVPAAFVETPLASVPLGLDAETISRLVALEDRAGYSLEVVAAMQDPKVRSVAQEAARSHRTIASSLAEVAQIAGTGGDPRAVTYALPFVLDANTPTASAEEIARLAGSLETELATQYLIALGLVEPQFREHLLDLALNRALLARHWVDTTDTFMFITDDVVVTGTETSTH